MSTLSSGISPAWRDRWAVLGVAAACCVAAKAARLLWLRAQLSLGPVLVGQYKGQWALVTGGSEGLGKATAAALAKQGLHVILVSRSQQKLDAAAADIRRQHPSIEVRTLAADLSKADSCRKLLQQLKGTPIRVLIANAGGGGGKGLAPYWEYSDAEEDAVSSLNGPSCYILTRGLLPGMIEAGGGAVVGISSIMSKWGIMAAPYGAEKAKMNAVMEALDGELRITGNAAVTAQAMMIGPVATPATAKLMGVELANSSSSSSDTASSPWQTAKGKKAMARFAPADDVGEAVVRAIGRVGPVVTPYWGHSLFTTLLFDSLWPPGLQRALQRRFTKQMMATMTAATAKA